MSYLALTWTKLSFLSPEIYGKIGLHFVLRPINWIENVSNKNQTSCLFAFLDTTFICKAHKNSPPHQTSFDALTLPDSLHWTHSLGRTWQIDLHHVEETEWQISGRGSSWFQMWLDHPPTCVACACDSCDSGGGHACCISYASFYSFHYHRSCSFWPWLLWERNYLPVLKSFSVQGWFSDQHG